MEIENRELLFLGLIPGVGPARLNSMVRHFRGTRGILRASLHELHQVEAMDRRTADSVLRAVRDHSHEGLRTAERQIGKLAAADGKLVTLWDEDYPENLRCASHPPTFLFVRGEFAASDVRAVAVVGTRRPTEYGRRLTGEFTRALVQSGFCIVSGLARGIDTLAHTTALECGGRTIAVIGSGIDVVYPPENRPLARSIAGRGALVSEFPMGTQPDAVNFPRRNRVISGLSAGTLVIETGVRGGAMITASIALEQNREVFALPSPLDSGKESGTNLLIKEGRAKLTESIDDIIAELSPHLPENGHNPILPPAAPPTLTLFEQKVLEIIPREPIHIDRIATSAGMPAHEVLVELLGLELKGLVRPLPGKLFQKT